MIRVLHIITCLNTGGAESMLFKVVSTMDRARFRNEVVSLWGKGVFGSRLEALGIKVHALNMDEHGLFSHAPGRLRKIVREADPHILQGWMYHGNLAACWGGWHSGKKRRFLWNVRHSVDRLRDEKTTTAAVILAGAALSRSVESIIYNSTRAVLQHERLGYSRSRSEYVANGFDLEKFRPDAEARAQVRQEIGISGDAEVIGMFQRWHPMKDHENLLHAVAGLQGRKPYLLLAGRGIDRENASLMAMMDRSGLGDRIILLGERHDIPRLYNAIDVLAVSSAWGEGFPNIVGEAMATGVPCAVTDTGDASLIVGPLGRTVPIRDSSALSTALDSLLEGVQSNRDALARDCRQRIESQYGLQKIVEQYEQFYEGSADPSE